MFIPYFISRGQAAKFFTLTTPQIKQIATENRMDIGHVKGVLEATIKVCHTNRMIVMDAVELTKTV